MTHDDHDHDHYYDDSYLHDNQFVFLKHYLETSATCKDGISYILPKLANEQTDKQMLHDCLEVYKAIKDASFLAGNLMKKLDVPAYQAIIAYNDIIPIYEKAADQLQSEKFTQVVNTFREELFPKYINWYNNMYKYLLPHIK